MILKLLNESVDLVQAVKDLNLDFFNNLKDTTIYQMLKAYSEDTGTNKNKIDIQDFISWVNDSDTPAGFALYYADYLTTDAICDLGKEDPDFVETVFNICKKIGWIDEEGNDLSTHYDPDEKVKRRHKPSFFDLCHEFIQFGRNKDDGDYPIELLTKAYYDNDYDFETKEELFKNLLLASNEGEKEEKHVCPECGKEICECGKSLKESKAAEDIKMAGFIPEQERPEHEKSLAKVEKEIEKGLEKVEPVVTPEREDEVLPKLNEDVEDLKFDPTPDILIKNGFIQGINSVINEYWSLISNLNGMLAQFESDYNGSNKEAVKEILNSLNDEATISIGMLNKCSELIDNKVSSLIDAGSEKAEEISK